MAAQSGIIIHQTGLRRRGTRIELKSGASEIALPVNRGEPELRNRPIG